MKISTVCLGSAHALVWSALLAEHLASLINQEPLPLPVQDQVDAVDPARFALRAFRNA